MKKIILAAAVALLPCSTANAELAKMECNALRTPMQVAVISFDSLSENLRKIGIQMPDIVQRSGSTPVGEAAYKFEAKRAALAEALKAFVEAGEDFTAELQKCAR